MTLQQGIMMGDFMQRTGRAIADTLEENREKKQYDQYSELIRAGKNPEEVSEIKNSINHRVLAKVLKDWHDVRMNDARYKEQVMHNRAMKVEQARSEVSEKLRVAHGLYQQAQKTGSKDFLAQSKQLIADAYEYFMDGVHMDYDSASDKFIRYTNDPDTGEKIQQGEIPVGSPEDIFAFAQQVLESGEFEKRFFTHAMAEDEYNWQALQEAEDVVDKNGKTVGILIKGRKMGKSDWQFSDFGDKVMPWPEARKQGYMLKSKYQADEKYAADVRAKQQQGIKDIHTKKEKVYKDIQTATGEFFEQQLTILFPNVYFKDGRYIIEEVDKTGLSTERPVDVSEAKKRAWAYQKGMEKLAEQHPDWDIIQLKREAQKEIDVAAKRKASEAKIRESLSTIDTVRSHEAKGLPLVEKQETYSQAKPEVRLDKTKPAKKATPLKEQKFKGAKEFADWWEVLMEKKRQKMEKYSKHPGQR